MSELKAHEFCESDEFFREYPGPLSNELRLYYLKSEADKVFAELKAQKAQAEDDCAYWKMCHGNASNAMHETEEYAMQLYDELRHSNYKRCLAMAEWCGEKWADIATTYGKSVWYNKWYKRWLELAELYKRVEK